MIFQCNELREYVERQYMKSLDDDSDPDHIRFADSEGHKKHRANIV